MTVYVVFTRTSTSNAAELANYRSKGPLTLNNRPATPLVFYGDFEVLDGQPIEAAAIITFPTKAEARDWYDSPAYQEARAHRLAGADYNVFMIEGV